MRPLYVVFGILLSILFWLGVDKVFAIDGEEVNGTCYAMQYNVYSCGSPGNPVPKFSDITFSQGWWQIQQQGDTWPKYWACDVVVNTYMWNGTTWVHAGSDNAQVEYNDYNGGAFSDWEAAVGIGRNVYPATYWPDGPPDLETCSDPSVNCAEKEGEQEQLLVFDGHVSTSDALCIEGCELMPTGITVSIKKNDCDSNGIADDPCTVMAGTEYTGEACPEGDPEGQEDPGCEYWENFCEEICVGGDVNFVCADEYGNPDCGCTLPDYPLIEDDGKLKPDQDEDGLPTGEPEETDADGDGDPDTTDPDPDGDGIIDGDADADGDGIDNRGDPTTQHSDTTNWVINHNGIGTDPDLDGDGEPNETDDNMDGDSFPNDTDSDQDGDGIRNNDDLDSDGDGILDDKDGDGDTSDEADDGDTNDDGGVNEDDPLPQETPDDLGSGGTCPDGEVCLGDGVCQAGEDETSSDCVGAGYLSTRWQELQDNIMATGVGSLVSLGDLPGSSDSQINVNLGSWGGETSFDLTQLNFAWALLNGLFTIMFCWLGIKIIILKHG